MEQYKEELSIINAYGKKVWRRSVSVIKRIRYGAPVQTLYVPIALLLLLASTVFWAILGARVQIHNADQLSDPYMFSDAATFHGALFPAAHTFLLKWPIFWLLHVFGVSSASLTAATVAVTVATVAALAYILYRIDRRPVVLGTVYLGLALILALVPPQSYAGSLLPVNMAMLTTRNVEYVAYLAAIILFVRAKRIRSWSFILGVLTLAVLIASDKLFIGLSVGGAALALVAYALISNWRMVSFSVRWLAGGVLAAVGASLLLFIVTKLHITHLVGGATTSPYSVGGGAKGLLLGVAYAGLGLFTNLGANPAYENRVISRLPHELLHGLMSVSGILHVVALILCIVALIGLWRTLSPTLKRTADQTAPLPRALLLSTALIWSTIAALGAFVASNHYYAVDARYLAIGFFALVVTVGTALRTYTVQRPNNIPIVGIVLVAGVVAACFGAHAVATKQVAAFDTLSGRNDVIAQTLSHHKVDVLVGDYWRVLPVKLAAKGKLTVTPLTSCTQPAAALTSSAWQPDLARHSFAYLISLDKGLTNYPACTLPEIIKAYGRPNAVQVVAGTLAAPQEALLFYDTGSHPPITTPPTPVIAPLLPVGIDQLTKTSCAQPTIMNVVAHEDDDLLFLSPDLIHELHVGNCVRTIYMTAGDSGYGKFYWLSRQLGAEAAYSTMLGVANVWDQQTIALSGGQYVTIATLRGHNEVSLIFLNLPDGNVHGDGFPDSGQESLAKLYANAIPTLQAIDKQSSYNSNQLVDTLVTLMDTYQPAEIHTQADVVSSQYPDHSDHIATSKFTELAAAQYSQRHFGGVVSIPATHYIGYPIHGYDANVSGDDLTQKQNAFFAYAHYDGGVCGSIARCARTPVYDSYLQRQYVQQP